ncbi:MAG: MFS transporter [Azonexus sp.]|jgi:predicted MFS family arabinose efflux permease|nr:MFS transporter [Azonexus sp.]
MNRVFLLTLGMFALGVDAYVVAGLLPGIAHSFSVTQAQAGQCVAVFTLSYAISAPVLSTLVGGKPVRTVLTIALAVFSVANAASVVAVNFPLLLAARALAGFGAGLFSPVAAATAAALVPEQRKGRALGMVLGGMSAGTVVGVPVGLWVNDWIGWRGTLGLVTLIGCIALVGVAARLPSIALRRPPSLRERLAVLTHGKVAVTVGITFMTAVGSLGLYTYLAPALHTLAGVTDVKYYLWAWGIGGLAGSFLIGPLIDRSKRPAALLGVILVALSLALAALPTLAPLGVAGFLPLLTWGAMGWSSLAPQQHMLLAQEPEHGAAAVALNSSCNYLGGAIGTFAGGALMASGISPAWLPYWATAAVLAALAGHVAKRRMPG